MMQKWSSVAALAIVCASFAWIAVHAAGVAVMALVAFVLGLLIWRMAE
jgi:hypothetical protein